MRTIFTSIQELFPELTQNKKLGLAWAIFIASVGWIIYFVQIYPAEKATFDRFSVEMAAAIADSESSAVIYDVVGLQILDAIQVRIYFLENFSGKYPYNSIEPETILQGYKQVGNVLSGIASARGILRGTNFSMQELNSYTEGFVQDLTLMETYIKSYEAFYLALIRNEAKEALDISADFDSSSALESISGFYSRLGSFSQETTSILSRNKVNIEEKTNEVILFNLKKMITWVTSLYALGFVPVVVIYHRRIQKKAKPRRRSRRAR